MATYYNENTIIWLDGAYVKAADAKMDLYSQSLHYGYSVFEGIRSYKTISGETKIFKAEEHYNRLKNSADAVNMPYPKTCEEATSVTYMLPAISPLADAAILPLLCPPATTSFCTKKPSNLM